MTLPLEGLLVVSVEQAVAAPHCTCRLADAGARVIKVERPEGDFARDYDYVVHGESAHFVWLNRGKQSVVLDLSKPDDKALMEAMLAKADVFVQNLKPGAIGKLGFPVARLRKDYPRLICCSISGYGESGPYAQRKAYDLLIQAESGLSSVTGGPEGAGARRRLGGRHRRRAQRLRGDPGGADQARAHRRGHRDFRLHVRRHGGMDDDSLAQPGIRQSVQARRPRASDHRRPTACSRRATAPTS